MVLMVVAGGGDSDLRVARGGGWGLWGRLVPARSRPGGFSAGVQERQAACAVQLEQVVDRALKAPLGAGGWLAADQHLSAVLDGADLAEHRLDDRFAPAVDLAAFLGPGLARHPLLGGGVLGDRPARR